MFAVNARRVVMRASAAVPRRFYTNGKEGAIRGAGDSFSKKEKAIEDQYFYEQEKEKLKKLREEVEQLKNTVEEHKKTLDEHKKKLEK